ncbi:MAG: RNA polymerase sigma factor, partial [Phycisphaeraceae bacterium]|nr:RNA polymerase sigma factor [Phycisphaeraceae bacterium]
MSQGLGELDVQRTLVLAAGGDASAWEALVGAYTGRVYGMALRRCGDAELAEEITQGTFVKVVEHLPRYQERGKFEAWLFRIALNLLRDQMRQRKRRGVSGGWQEDEEQESAWAMGQTDVEAGPMERASRNEMV